MMSDGRLPLSRLARRLRILSAPSFPSVLAGIGPDSPTPGSRRVSTWVWFESHLTPIQEVQIGVARFQLSFRPWGTVTEKLRRACLSEFRSAVAGGRIKIRKRRKDNDAKEKDLSFGCFMGSSALAIHV